MALIKCPQCGTTISDQSEACMKCRYPIKNLRAPKPAARPIEKESQSEEPKKMAPESATKCCINCGSKIAPGAKFCPECGNPQHAPLSQTCNPEVSAEPKAKKSVDASKGGKKIIVAVICFVILILAFAIPLYGEDSPNEPTPSEPVMSETEYRALCKEIDYKELFRYSESHEGEMIKIVGQVSQIMTEGGYTVYRVSTLEEYGLYYDDEFCVFDDREDDDLRILDGDIIEVYGTYDGLTKWEYAISKTEVEVPTMYARFIDLVEE